MTDTPEQLREEATQLERENCDVMKVDQRTQIALLRAHAAALERATFFCDALYRHHDHAYCEMGLEPEELQAIQDYRAAAMKGSK